MIDFVGIIGTNGGRLIVVSYRERAYMSHNKAATSYVYPLTPAELEAFGWSPDQVVCSIRSPEGKRTIPTRQVTSSGLIFYGDLETMEPPEHIPAEVWSADFGSWEEPVRGPMM